MSENVGRLKNKKKTEKENNHINIDGLNKKMKDSNQALNKNIEGLSKKLEDILETLKEESKYKIETNSRKLQKSISQKIKKHITEIKG